MENWEEIMIFVRIIDGHIVNLLGNIFVGFIINCDNRKVNRIFMLYNTNISLEQ